VIDVSVGCALGAWMGVPAREYLPLSSASSLVTADDCLRAGRLGVFPSQFEIPTRQRGGVTSNDHRF
jgi:hypothetical protein